MPSSCALAPWIPVVGLLLVGGLYSVISFFKWRDNSWPRHSNSLLMFLALLLCIDAPGMFPALCASTEEDVPVGVVGRCPTAEGTDAKLNFLHEQYATAAAEIGSRLEHEQTLFVLKFSLVGAILGLLFALGRSWAKQGPSQHSSRGPEQKPDQTGAAQETTFRSTSGLKGLVGDPLAITFLWAAVVTSAIIDVRMGFNASFLRVLGAWVAILEACDPAIPGWESFLRVHHLGREVSLYPLIGLHGALLTLLLLGTVLVLVDRESLNNQDVKRVCRWGGTALFVALALVGGAFRITCWPWLAWCAVCSAAGVGLTQFNFRNGSR